MSNQTETLTPLSLDSIRLEAIQKMEIADRLVELQCLLSKAMPGHRVIIVKGEPEQDTYRRSPAEIEQDHYFPDKP